MRRPSTLSLSIQLDVPDNVICSRRASSIRGIPEETKDPGKLRSPAAFKAPPRYVPD